MSFIIASHDTMSYEKPKAWYLKPFHFVAKCQSLSIFDQYEQYGIRLFDLRIRWNKKDNKWVFSHGCMVFDTPDVEDILSWLNDRGSCMVRLVLEYNSPTKNIDEISDRFCTFCDEVIKNFPNIQFFEFRRKYDWKKLYTYLDEPNPDLFQATSSMTGKIIDDWWPWLYAWLFNKDVLNQGTTHEYLLMDFIGLGF